MDRMGKGCREREEREREREREEKERENDTQTRGDMKNRSSKMEKERGAEWLTEMKMDFQ